MHADETGTVAVNPDDIRSSVGSFFYNDATAVAGVCGYSPSNGLATCNSDITQVEVPDNAHPQQSVLAVDYECYCPLSICSGVPDTPCLPADCICSESAWLLPPNSE